MVIHCTILGGNIYMACILMHTLELYCTIALRSSSVYTWKVEMIKYDRLNVGCEKMKGVKDNVKCFGLKNGKDMAVIN